MSLPGRQQERQQQGIPLHEHCRAWHTLTSLFRANTGVALPILSCPKCVTTGSNMGLLSFVTLCQELITNIQLQIEAELDNTHLRYWTPPMIFQEFTKTTLQKIAFSSHSVIFKAFLKEKHLFPPPCSSPLSAFIQTKIYTIHLI